MTTSSVAYVAIGVVVLVLGTATKKLVAPPEPVPVTFVKRIVKSDPPPVAQPERPTLPSIPKPKMEPRRAMASSAAAIVPKKMKVRKVESLPRKELVVPKEPPKSPPKEIDASLDKGVAVAGNAGAFDPAGLEGSAGRDASSFAGEDLPPGTVRPKPLKSNRPPPYPRSARMRNRTGVVVMRFTVRADGSLTDLAVVRGEHPFADAAMKAVRRWRYEPALFEGRPVSAPHTIEIRFKLNA